MRCLVFLIVFVACDAFEPHKVSDIHWVDGDSGTIDGERFRLANVDAPEIGNAECDRERALGNEAKHFVRNFSDRSEILVIGDYGFDRYDRRVVELSINGEDVIEVMKTRGYLKPWEHRNGRSLRAKPVWC